MNLILGLGIEYILDLKLTSISSFLRKTEAQRG
jgi:hypothetical protein